MNKARFTLIELLVVVAIIGILASLLLPSLGKARKKARQAVCLSQQKQVSIGSVLYSDDNEGKIVASWIGGYENALASPNHPISYDDYLGDYMGRILTLEQKRSQYVYPTDSISKTNEIFLCPLDETPSAFAPAYRRTYAMNGFVAKRDNPPGSNAIKYSELSDSAGTILLTEYPIAENSLGKDGRSGLWIPSMQVDSGGYDYHGKYKFNYLYADRHASLASVFSTVGSGSIDAALGQWTPESND